MTSEVIVTLTSEVYGCAMTDVFIPTDFGTVLRDWRNRRSRSQLALASDAGVSQRHLSFLETGRSKPSREMVLHLGVVLDVPLRDRNAMLTAAGFAPLYAERSIDDPELADIRRALQLMLDAHEPFPAYVIGRHWQLVLANAAAGRLISKTPETAQALAGSVHTFLLHPDGVGPLIDNFDEVAATVMRRLERELADRPGDERLAEILEEIRLYPNLPDAASVQVAPRAQDLLVPLNLTLDGRSLSFLTTISTLSGPTDITLEELRLETLLPANRETEEQLRAWQPG